ESGGVALDGSPDPGYWGKLSLVAGPDSTTEAFALEGDEVTIGREVGDIVFPEDGFVSGSHAVIEREGDTVRLRDLDSSNGTFVRIRERHRVDDGERVLMGQQLFRLEVQ
ncbi:MAG: FHA domain-containing protein, partial [Bradymonadaceae bacterium]